MDRNNDPKPYTQGTAYIKLGIIKLALSMLIKVKAILGIEDPPEFAKGGYVKDFKLDSKTLNPLVSPRLTKPPPPPEPPKKISIELAFNNDKLLSGLEDQLATILLLKHNLPTNFSYRMAFMLGYNQAKKVLKKSEGDKPSDFIILSGKVTPIIDLSDKEEAITKAHLEAGPDAQFKEGFEAAIEYVLNKIKN